MAEERSSSYICAEDISVGYHNLPLIQKINLHVNRGEILTLIGPNGAGKSTILKSLIGQLKLVKGAVWLDGTSMGTMKEKEIALRMSVMMTGRVKTERMTCEEVVSMGRYPYTGKMGILTEKDWQIVRESLELVQGLELAEKDFEAVSDGQRQRVLLARAICQEPQVIVLDEPTAFLDIRHKLELLYLLKNMVREKKVAVLMSLHYLDLADRTPVSEEQITFGGLKDGLVRGTKYDHTMDHKLCSFLKGKSTEQLKELAESCGGKFVESNADLCVRLEFLPFYPLWLKIWLADEEFETSGKLLLSKSADHYLTIEDAVTVGDVFLRKIRSA